jgi:8-oxo-dGTP diphosphatase
MSGEEENAYFKLGVSVTNVLFCFEDGQLKIFIQRIKKNPYSGAWSLPGRLIYQDERLDDVSKNIAEEAIGNQDVYLEQLNAFGKVYRHPQGRVIDVAFYGLINLEKDVSAQNTTSETQWCHARNMPELAFDHYEMVEFSLHRLRRRLENRPIGFKLLPAEFTLSELQALYEEILNHPLDKRNFQKKLKKLNVLVPKGQDASGNPGRRPRLFSFDEGKYDHYMEMGF